MVSILEESHESVCVGVTYPKANGTVSFVSRLRRIMKANNYNLAKEEKDGPEEPLPLAIRIAINRSLTKSSYTLAHEHVEKKLASQVEDEAYHDGAVA